MRLKPEDNAIHNSASGRMSRTKPGFAKSPPTANSTLPTSIQSVYSFPIIVPVVQRTEQGFPNGKTAFLQQSAHVIISAQIAPFKSVE
jgi:hypothetical protein